MLDIINKSSFNWNFNEDDWFLDLVLNKPDLRYKIFTLKNYSLMKINDIVFEIYNAVKEYRTELENSSQSFIKKKKYLMLKTNNDKIQISLDEEYQLKDAIEKYKIYELISWFHIGKNSKIYKHCTLKKQEILENIYPIVDLSIRKVIGSKVISPFRLEFEEAVNNAWLSIFKYLTKIDTSKVMFSIFVGIAHRSAIYYNVTHLKEKYNTVKFEDILSKDDNGNCVAEDSMLNHIISKDPNNEYSDDNVEDDILNEIDYINIEEMFYLENSEDEIDVIIDSLNLEDNKVSNLQQNILTYSYNILSGRIKKLCYEKIFAEFFNDLINSQISEKIITKYTPILTEIMDVTTIKKELIHDEKYINEVYKLYKDWVKDKINIKMHKYNIQPTDLNDLSKKEHVLELIKRENNMLNYIKENKKDIIVKLIEFKNNCTNLNFR